MMDFVIVFGNDHTNTVGVIQSLGRVGLKPIALLYGEKTGYVKSSKFTTKVLSACDEQACVDLLLSDILHDDTQIPIIACSDSAELAINDNREKLLKKHFVFGGKKSGGDLRPFFEKNYQVQLAIESGFNVPSSWKLNDKEELPVDLDYPCLVKPLVSSKGAKCDIRICRNKEELLNNLSALKYTEKVIIQQYINHDYEISILGCAKLNGECIIPVVENKLSLYPKHVGLECLANMQPLLDEKKINSIITIIDKIGYVGLFSVEMMHCKADGKFYFTEINLRNDGAQSFVYKYGINLPAIHYYDLMNKQFDVDGELHPGYYIWDMHHFKSLLSREIFITTWIKELCKTQGFLMYSKDDKKPFYMQYLHLIKKALSFKQNSSY